MSSRIDLPEAFGRRLSLGPFARPVDLLRFLLLTSVSLLVVPWAGWGPAAVGSVTGIVLNLPLVGEQTPWAWMSARVAYTVRQHLRRDPCLSEPELSSFSLWVRDPYPLTGKTEAQRLQDTLLLLRTLATLRFEVWLIRVPVRFDPELWRAPGHRGVHECGSRQICRGYERLLSQICRERRLARIALVVADGSPGALTGPGGPGSGWTPGEPRRISRLFSSDPGAL
jgi:hypothetical protein